MENQLENIKDFHQNDVLSGKGNSVNRHAGNVQLRAIVSELKYEYVTTPRKYKQVFSKMIVKRIRSMNPPGRFLMKDKSTGLWNDIGDAGPTGAWSKTRMVLREGAPAIQKKIEAGEIKVTTNFLAEMDPKEREDMANEIVRRNRKKGVKKKEKAEPTPKVAPIAVEQTTQAPISVEGTTQSVPYIVPESNEAIPLVKVEKEHSPNDTPDPATSTIPNLMLPPEPVMMSSYVQMGSMAQLHETFNTLDTPDPEISTEPSSMLPPEPITNSKLHRNSLYLSDIDEDFVAEMRKSVMEGDLDFGDESSDEGCLSELDEDEPEVVGPAAPIDAGASFFMPNLKESTMLPPTHDQTSKGDPSSKSVANSNLNNTSLSLSAVFGMSVQSSQYTMTSSKMSLCSNGLSSLMQKSIMSASTLGSFQSMSISGTESKAKNQSKNKIENKDPSASVVPSRIDINKNDYEPSPIFAGNPTSLPENTSGNSNFAQHRQSQNSEASHYFRQSQHPRAGPNTVSVTSSDISSHHSSFLSGGISRDNSGRSIHSEYSSLAGYPFMNSFDTKGESQQSLGHPNSTVGRAAGMVPPTESFGESFNQGTESFPHNSQSYHHGQGFMSDAINNNGASFGSSITSNGTNNMQGYDFSSHNDQSLHHGGGFAPILPTPGVNHVSLTSSTVGTVGQQGHVVFGDNGQSFQPGQSIVSNINDGDTASAEFNSVSVANQGQLVGSSQVRGHLGQAKRRQSYCRTGHIAMPVFTEFDGDEDDEVLAEALNCFAEG